MEELEAIRAVAAERGLPVHMDGARLWNASVATGSSLSELASCAKTVMVAFSKGLGAPIGAALGRIEAPTMETAWTARKLFGGAMRQSGILAAAVLYALDHHMDRLADDHANARALAAAVTGAGGATVVEPDTNIVMIDLPPGRSAAAVVARGEGAGRARFRVDGDARPNGDASRRLARPTRERAGQVVRDAHRAVGLANTERERVHVARRRRVDVLELVDFERASDAIAGEVLENREHDELVVARTATRSAGMNRHSRLVRRERHGAGDLLVPAACCTPSARCSSPWSSGVGNVTMSGSRVPARGGRIFQLASTIGVWIAGPARNSYRKECASGRPLASFHVESTRSAYARPAMQRASHLLVRTDATFHAARIEEQRVARVIGIPEVGVEREERVLDLVAGVVDQMHELGARLARHRRRELDVDAEQVLGQRVAGRQDSRDDRRRPSPVRCGSETVVVRTESRRGVGNWLGSNRTVYERPRSSGNSRLEHDRRVVRRVAPRRRRSNPSRPR